MSLGVGQSLTPHLSNINLSRSQKKFTAQVFFLNLDRHNLPEVGDLDEAPSGGAVPGVLVDEKEDDLLQTYRDLAQNLAHVFRQLKYNSVTANIDY